MLPVALAALLAAAASAESPTLLAQAMPREMHVQALPDDLSSVVEQALPPPPATVVRKTRYFGTVTVDHKAHLARRARCAGCHDPGPITKITFTPAVAHDRCVGCHKAEAKGPTSCRDCHVKEEPALERKTALATQTPAVSADRPIAGAATPAPAAAATVAYAAPSRPAAVEPAPATAVDRAVPAVSAFSQSYEVGLTGGIGWGASLRLVSREDRAIVTYALERITRESMTRTLGLIGGGFAPRFSGKLGGELEGVAGIDAVETPRLAAYPAAGLRAGVVVRRPLRWLEHVRLSATALTHVSRDVGFAGSRGVVFTTLSIGLPVARP